MKKSNYRILRRNLILLTVFTGLNACANKPAEIVAHRGASFDAPENTLASFNLAWERKADAIEGDFFLTKDSTIVCIHDKTTGRLAGVDLSVAHSTLAELKVLDVGAWKGAEWTGERIPTLDEVLVTVPDGKKIFIEIKCGPEILPELKRSLTDSPLDSDQIVIISFNKDVIAAVKEQIPVYKAYWLTGFRKDDQSGRWQPALDNVLSTLKTIGADGLDCRADDVVDGLFAKALKAAGMELHVWTVDDPDKARFLQDIGVRSITTNRPEWLRRQLR
jgi:glycerophosphoryl diester phosphodiesterase